MEILKSKWVLLSRKQGNKKMLPEPDIKIKTWQWYYCEDDKKALINALDTDSNNFKSSVGQPL